MSTPPESSYIGRHAELYDLFYAEKPYAEEVAFIHQCIQNYGSESKRILELACGTGSHSLLLEKQGYQIVATDYSADMLACARKKGQSAGSSVEFRQQDMRLLDLPEQPFDVVVCLFDSIGYVATNENISQVLRAVHDHLVPGGLFIFEFWHAGAMLRRYDPVRVRRFANPNGEVIRISETAIDFKEQLCHVTYTIIELSKDGIYHTIQETQINRFFLLQEMRFFLQQAGFSPIKWFSGFHESEQIREDTWHILAVARKV